MQVELDLCDGPASIPPSSTCGHHCGVTATHDASATQFGVPGDQSHGRRERHGALQSPPSASRSVLICLLQAQGLHHVITTAERLLASEHRLHALIQGDTMCGILKTGEKKLFVRVTPDSPTAHFFDALLVHHLNS